MQTYVPVALTTPQTIVLQQIRRLGQVTVRQVVGATAMSEPDAETILRELDAIGVVSENGGRWRTRGD
jgi:alkylation response protein AidB-like acyl-CoA dehydrogenase